MLFPSLTHFITRYLPVSKISEVVISLSYGNQANESRVMGYVPVEIELALFNLPRTSERIRRVGD